MSQQLRPWVSAASGSLTLTAGNHGDHIGVTDTLTAPGGTCFGHAAWRLPLYVLDDEAFCADLAAIFPKYLEAPPPPPQSSSAGGNHGFILSVAYASSPLLLFLHGECLHVYLILPIASVSGILTDRIFCFGTDRYSKPQRTSRVHNISYDKGIRSAMA